MIHVAAASNDTIAPPQIQRDQAQRLKAKAVEAAK